ncbi:hypothetical protein CRG98_044249 [Punica granatum]|uniref:Uncharacterized protein n=1 Tax=Punica granatum TaxID=22663 RepID=A0A2I0HUI6_PUNGR|nr:hypothetical protein CRG98_044249 [Punica granatum]
MGRDLWGRLGQVDRRELGWADTSWARPTRARPTELLLDRAGLPLDTGWAATCAGPERSYPG